VDWSSSAINCAALVAADRLDAEPWADRARSELAATGETAAALFLSPKTIEYHLRHVYLKLGIHSREELARVLARSSPVPGSADVEAGRVVELGR
jgi:Bacterial regulatory proteins, luxR family